MDQIDIMYSELAITPTVFIAGLNRSGTTALVQSFLNIPDIEVFKEPGKITYSTTGSIDFSHFFVPPTSPEIKARVIKQSIGHYTTDLCTIPLYPTMNNKPCFLRQFHSIFIIRKPSLTWNSWEIMTQWIQRTDEPTVVETWEDIRQNHGVEIGWGSFSLFRLAFLYLYETIKYIQAIAPDNFTIVCLEDLSEPAQTEKIFMELCERSGIVYDSRMLNWEIAFGTNTSRLNDGFASYGSIHGAERKFIHRNLLNSRGIRKIENELVIDQNQANEIESGELGEIYHKLREWSLSQLRSVNYFPSTPESFASGVV